MTHTKIYNSIPDAALFISILLACLLDYAFPITRVIPSPNNFIGLGIVVIGFVVALYTLSFLKSKHTSTNAAEMPSTIITNGPFAVSRNPVYLAYVVVVVGVSIYLGSLSAFIAPIICFIVLNSITIPFEEKAMMEAFGQKYEEYRRLVRRWI